ncbi:hypothetical protein EB1_25460 [Empedobacter brevis NBRC 14943 = ATCC 43319]|uniref:Uncharacterized protein n=1 Tax=Empedobacter brevis NBRC 14943 = ATCC 43319 TaxID=1218108 RepID=A0A511NJ39_9FLAO|nr:hypothetical protein [Empedobacter brevis]GEM52756.1 hypothetical protein EB1_25460 [Empedobacter brevis NBRC 14943 = ATCC 43319]
MNYATQHHIGDYQIARTATTTTATPPVKRVRKLDAKAKRYKRSAERQAEIRTDSHVTDGFLKCTFLPKLKIEQSVQACQQSTKMERDFYTSLFKVAKSYSIEPMCTQAFNYPYNVALAMCNMQTKLKRTVKNWDNLYLAKSRRKTFLAKKEVYDTYATLYYIPVIPLFQMLAYPKKKKNAHLLLSVFSYLYRIADIPYYRQEESYLYWHYETHNDWIEQEDDEDTENCKSELRKSEQVGDKMLRKISNPVNLKIFEQRLRQFKPRDTFDHECWRIACNAFALYTEYPTARIFRNEPIRETDPYNDLYDSETIRMEKYISFCADTEGWLYDSMKDCINNEFNECGAIDEPTIYKAIDGSRIAGNDFDFEKRLFVLLDELCSLLYEFKEELK